MKIIQDKDGNYFLMKNDGTFQKLPKPKPGNKYIIKRNITKKRKKFLETGKESKKKNRHWF